VTASAFWRPYANLNLAALDHCESGSTPIFIMTLMTECVLTTSNKKIKVYMEVIHFLKMLTERRVM